MKNFFSRVFSTIVGNLLTFSLILLVLIGFIFFSALTSSPTKPIKDGSVLEITLDSPIMESEMDRVPMNLFNLSNQSNSSFYLDDILRAIKNAETDKRIKGISLKIEQFQGGFTQADDIRTALQNFKKSGKFVYAFTNNTSQTSYYIQTVADKVYQNPLGMTMLQGLGAEVMFYKNFGDKYGVDFQVIRHGAYKSAVEPYLRSDLSPENREQITEYMNDIWTNISTKMAKDRQLSLTDFNIKVDSLYAFIPEKAKENKLIDDLMQESQYDMMILKKLDDSATELSQKAKTKHFVSLDNYILQLDSNSNKNKIGILYASGAITEGDGFDGIQSKTYIEAIQKMAEDDKIKAVVLRINSPGGSANASEQILYELDLLRKKKPVVVSFGDVAASGGYYIAQSSERIFANPTTITGSIGVLGMIPNVKKLANSVGITTDIAKTNANADQLKSLTNPLSADAERTMRKSIESIYHQFVSHISKNRKMTFEAVDKIGGGHVWSGTKAKELGLVDEFGGLQDAINYAAKLVKLDAYSTEAFPKRKDAFEEFMASITGNNIDAKLAQELGTEGQALYKQIKLINEQKGIQVRMPFNVTIK